MRYSIRARSALVACGLLLLSGCYAIEDSPERTVIRFAPFWRFVMIAFPVGTVGVCLAACLYRPVRIPAALGAAGVAGLSALIVPGMYLDRVVITPTEITQKTGLWFAPMVKGFRYADVRAVSIRTVQKKNMDVRRWVVTRIDGTTWEIDPGDLWEYNESVVVAKLRGYGVRVE